LTVELGKISTRSERGRRNAAVKELRDVGATPDEISARVREYRKRWPHLTLTETALVKHWSALANPDDERRVVMCPECGLGFQSERRVGEHMANVHGVYA